jgi:hypothetical protein
LTRGGRFELNYLSRRRGKPTSVGITDGSLNSWLERRETRLDIVLEIRLESEFLNVGAIGEFSLQEAKRTFLEMLEAVARYKVEKVLFDGRRLTGDPKTMERFYYGEFAADSVFKFRDRGVSPASKFAYVLKEPVLDPRRFGETVAVNRGMYVKAFDNLEDAFGWLGIAPPNKPHAGDG